MKTYLFRVELGENKRVVLNMLRNYVGGRLEGLTSEIRVNYLYIRTAHRYCGLLNNLLGLERMGVKVRMSRETRKMFNDYHSF